MKIRRATDRYEAWLGRHVSLVAADLRRKHAEMRTAVFPFLRATYYRWAQRWPKACKSLAAAPRVLAVGDLHVENFGTWRDAEGRLVWGINDFDEAWRLPYTNDLVRLATSAFLAIDEGHLGLAPEAAAAAILDGYRDALGAGGRALVLTERHHELRAMATARLHNPTAFWKKLQELPGARGRIPSRVLKTLQRALPEPNLPHRVARRVGGLGSLGHPRFVAIAEWHGAQIVREAKALGPPASVWAAGGSGKVDLAYEKILRRSIRCPDPFVAVTRGWLVRRLAPDCARIELGALPKERDEVRLLTAMGWETANVHLGTSEARGLRQDLGRRHRGWLLDAAQAMVQSSIVPASLVS